MFCVCVCVCVCEIHRKKESWLERTKDVFGPPGERGLKKGVGATMKGQ